MPDMNSHQSQELDFTPVENEKPVPAGWWVLFGGLIAFGVFYLWEYTPWFTGWTQSGELNGSGGAAAAGTGMNIFATIVFTALATVAAVTILLALARKRAR